MAANPVSDYDVTIDPASLKAWEAGEGVGYNVRLMGSIDGSWVRCYLSLWTGLVFFSRFHLDLARSFVSFPCEQDADEKDVRSVLEIFDAMLRVTNRRAAGGTGPEKKETKPLTEADTLTEADLLLEAYPEQPEFLLPASEHPSES